MIEFSADSVIYNGIEIIKFQSKITQVLHDGDSYYILIDSSDFKELHGNLYCFLSSGKILWKIVVCGTGPFDSVLIYEDELYALIDLGFRFHINKMDGSIISVNYTK